MRRWLPDAEYRWINSPAFLRSPEWRDLRQDAIRLNDGRCECCKRSFDAEVVLNVDHVRPRATHPHLALDRRNLQCLCGGIVGCNARKGNRHRDYRSVTHPHRWLGQLIAWWRS